MCFCFTVALASCSGEDGADGATGAQGPARTNGTDGVDGNANVQRITFDMTEYTGTLFVASDVAQLTDEVIAEDAILFYLEVGTKNSRYYTFPGLVPDKFTTNAYVETNTVSVSFTDFEGMGYIIGDSDNLKSLRIIIIESNLSTSAKSSKVSVESELKSASVDINDYNAVVQYYGLD